MKKILKNKLILGVALLGVLSSCNYNEDDDETLNTRLDKPVVTLNSTSFSAVEGEPVTITLTSNKAITTPMEFKLELVSGTGSFREYEVDGDETYLDLGSGPIGHIITFPAYTTEYTFTITPTLDFDAESTETFNYRIYGSSNSAGNIAPGMENFTVEVANAVSDDFLTVFDWSEVYADAFGTLHDGEYTDDEGEAHALCDFDFDLEIYDPSFSIYDVDYDNCPAQVAITADAPDGDYYVIASLWTVEGPAVPGGIDLANPLSDFVFPVKITLGKPGAFSKEIDMTGLFSYRAGGLDDGNDAAQVPVAIVSKTGNTYVLRDFNDPDVIWGQGRFANTKSLFKGRKK